MCSTSNILPSLSDRARLWVYAFNRPLTEEEASLVERAFRKFVSGWRSHGRRVTGGFTLLYDQFLLLAAEADEEVSGCSIDGSVALFKRLREDYGLDALDRSCLHFRDSGAVHRLSRTEFARAVSEGRISQATMVFDNTIQTVGELRAGRWELPLARSWHAQAFSA